MKVKIKSGYIDQNKYRLEVGQVVGEKWNDIYGQDYLILFPNGEIEPFNAHEFEVVS